MQDIESDMGYDTRWRSSDGVLALLSQTAVCDTCGSAPPASQRRDGSQSLDLQRAALRAEGLDEAANLYHDFTSGVRDDRPGLDSCVRALRKGDVLVVLKLDRLGRPRSPGAAGRPDRATARKRQQRRPHPSSASDSTNRTRSAGIRTDPRPTPGKWRPPKPSDNARRATLPRTHRRRVRRLAGLERSRPAAVLTNDLVDLGH